MIDELYHTNESLIPSTSNPASCKKNIGGVMGNIARHLSLLGIETGFITVLGNDSDANFISHQFENSRLSLEHALKTELPTGKYVAFHQPDGELFTAVCTDTLSHLITPAFLETKLSVLRSAAIIMADTNLEIETLQWLSEFSIANNKKLIIEPVSVIKARKLRDVDMRGVFMITPNEDELISISVDYLEESSLVAHNMIENGLQQLWLRLGRNGSVMYCNNQSLELSVPEIIIRDSTGAGDAALAAWVYAFLSGYDDMESLKIAHSFAMEILQTDGAVDHTVTSEKLLSAYRKYYHG